MNDEWGAYLNLLKSFDVLSIWYKKIYSLNKIKKARSNEKEKLTDYFNKSK